MSGKKSCIIYHKSVIFILKSVEQTLLSGKDSLFFSFF